MRLKEILKEGMHSVVGDLTERASQELFNYDYVYRTRGGMSMFTRGDGMKYRDPNIIFFGNDDAIETLKDYKSGKHEYASAESKAKWHPIWTKIAKTSSQDGIEQFWNWLQQQPNVKKANFRVSAEFGSSEYRDVLTLGKYIFILDGNQIQYGTKSLLRNSPIWRVEKD